MLKSRKKFLALAMTLVLAFSVATVSAAGVEKAAPVDIIRLVPAEDGDSFLDGSNVAELPDGSLLAVWSQGDGGPEGTTTRIMGARLPAGEKNWTEPFAVIDVFGVADMDPVLYVDQNGTLWMFWYPVMSAVVETAQLRFAYASEGSYEFTAVGNAAPDWDWSDTVPLKIGMISGNPIQEGQTKVKGMVNGTYIDNEWIEDTFLTRVKEDYADLTDYLTGEGASAGDLETRYTNVLQKIGGDDSYQIFTPTVADKLWPKSGVVQRSGYPLLRRIGWQTKGTPVEITVKAGTLLSNGQTAGEATNRMVLPLYSEGLGMSMMILTDDGGKTWMVSEPIIGDDNLQPVLVKSGDGLLAIMKTGEGGFKQGKAQVAFSEDGYTWDVARYSDSIPDSGNGLDAVLVGDSQVVVTADEDGLTVALSKDNGDTWNTRTIEAEADTAFAHPSAAVNGDGKICITYTVVDDTNGNTVQFVTVDEAWITEAV